MTGMVIKPCDPGRLENPGHLFQTAVWGRLKERFGWKAFAFNCEIEEYSFGFLLLAKTLPAGQKLCYVPYGPLVPELFQHAGFLSRFAVGVTARLPFKPLCIRFDIPWEVSADELSAPGLRDSKTVIQPPDTVLLDITPGEDHILSAMKSKTRYNVRLAAKKGVEVSSCGIDGIDDFYSLYEQTAERDGIAIHGKDYYKALFEEAARETEKAPVIEMYKAYHEGELLAAVICSFYGGQGIYLYGASNNKKRNLMPAYALQWHAIKRAKELGCNEYDFFGIPPAEDREHRMHGLYRFKTGFGGRIVRRGGCIDFVTKPILYKAYRLIENIRFYYYRTFKKR